MCYLLIKEIKNTKANSLVSFFPNLGLKNKNKNNSFFLMIA